MKLAETPPTYEEARDALIELFVLAASSANYRYTKGGCMPLAEKWFATAMQHVLASKPLLKT